MLAVVDRMQIDADLVLPGIFHASDSHRAAVQSTCRGCVRGRGSEAEKASVAHAAIAVDLRWCGGGVPRQRIDGNSSTVGDADDGNVHAFSVAADEGGDESDDGGDQGGAAMGWRGDDCGVHSLILHAQIIALDRIRCNMNGFTERYQLDLK